jgi:hypothetical protein
MIDTALVLGLPEPVETYSSSDHLYEMLNIPAGSSGRITKVKNETPKVSKVSKDTKVEKAVKSEPRAKRERTRTKRITS